MRLLPSYGESSSKDAQLLRYKEGERSQWLPPCCQGVRGSLLVVRACVAPSPLTAYCTTVFRTCA